MTNLLLHFHQLEFDSIRLTGHSISTKRRTLLNLIDNLLCSFWVKIIDHDICPTRSIEEGIAVTRVSAERVNERWLLTYILPSPPPAPVITTMCPLNDRVMIDVDIIPQRPRLKYMLAHM